jgi:hypothetical protein
MLVKGDGEVGRGPEASGTSSPRAECVDPSSEQKLKDITDIPNGLVVSAAEDAGSRSW